MRELTTEEVAAVSGGGAVTDSVIGWVIGKTLDAVANYVTDVQPVDAFQQGDAALPANVYGA